ncbi:MAG: glycoside hydrolase family 13 protein [Ruminococcaceae bacterium]|nr:glycoside hydrolase family 13 protein [Oscillospiraceae bacterium]
MLAFHNSHDLTYRAPFGAAPTNTEITLALDLTDPVPGYSCSTRLWQEECGETLIPMQSTILPDGTVRFSCTFTTDSEPGLLWYAFRIISPDGSTCYYCNRPDGLGGEGTLEQELRNSYQITVYQPAPVPQWYKQAVVYQIFPERFARGSDWLQRFDDARHPDDWKGPRRFLHADWDDQPFYLRAEDQSVTHWGFFGGTLEGIREKLPYLQELGITAIYLNPIFEAASNHKYDTANYLRIDPGFGDEESFRRLAEDAKQRGIRLILDGVFSHTGADSIYFNRFSNYKAVGACQSEESPYYDWYRFKRYPGEYEAWWGVKDLPNVEELNESYQDFIFRGDDSVIRHWLRCGASGWRLDVADELPDSFIEGIRTAIKEENPDALLMGEVWEDASNKRSYDELRRYLLGSELDCTMHYPFRTAMLDFFLGKTGAETVAAQMMSLKENYPPENYYGALNLVGSHDRVRVLSMLGEAPEHLSEKDQQLYRLSDEQLHLAKRRLKALSVLQFTAAGVPCIYYGDEAGMQGLSDPYNRAPFPWGKEDKDLTDHYRALITLRKTNEVLVSGDFLPLNWGDDVYGCLRQNDKEQILCLVNRSSTDTASCSLPKIIKRVKSLFGACRIAEDCSSITLTPLGYTVLQIEL